MDSPSTEALATEVSKELVIFSIEITELVISSKLWLGDGMGEGAGLSEEGTWTWSTEMLGGASLDWGSWISANLAN